MTPSKKIDSDSSLDHRGRGRTRLFNKSIMLIGVLLIAVTLVNFQQETQGLASPHSMIHDTHFIPAMSNLSRLVPEDAVLVVSTYAPVVAYFTGHTARIPLGVSSEAGLANYMRDRGYVFLVVFENKSDVPQLRTLFSSKGLKALESTFVQIANYRTDFSVILVYRLNSL